MWTPAMFAEDYIARWEGGLSVDPNDAGNWSTGKKAQGRLLGSQYGVTGLTLAAYKRVPIDQIHPADIQTLTRSAAVQICLGLFYDRPNLDNLVWCHVSASVLDMGWGAGPVTAIKLLQDMLDVDQDGVISAGGETARAFSAFLNRSEAAMAGAWWAMRERYYEDLVARRPTDGIYLRGWDNRSRYFLPGDAGGWWDRFTTGA